MLELLAPVEPLPRAVPIVEGIQSTIFGVRDLEQARRYFTEAGVTLVPGSAPGRLALPAEHNLGITFEFTE